MMFGWIILFAIVFYFWDNSNSRHSQFEHKGSQKNAVEILQERFARGEIDSAEFYERKHALESE